MRSSSCLPSPPRAGVTPLRVARRDALLVCCRNSPTNGSLRLKARFKSRGYVMITGMTISAVARQAGLQPSAIRYYERVGLLPPPIRAQGQRRYDAHVLQQLAVIGTA